MPLEHIEFGAAAKSDVLNNNFMYLDNISENLKTIVNESVKDSIYYEILSEVTIDIPASSVIAGTVYEVI